MSRKALTPEQEVQAVKAYLAGEVTTKLAKQYNTTPVTICNILKRHGHQPTVHHISNDKQNNTIENLQFRHGQHGKHAAFECGDCGSINVIEVPLKGSPEEE